MPEKPRRRKNNKHKRKNNKTKIDINKNNIDESESSGIASSSILNEDNSAVETSESTSELVSEKLNEESLSEPCSPITEKSSKTIEKEENEEIIVSQKYIVETPDQILKVKPKLDNNVKSKSCDNDDSPTIIEITDDSNDNNGKKWSIIESTGVIISTEEPNIEWENVNELKIPESELIEGISSSNTIPLNIAHCQQTMSLSPEEELSLRNYLETLNLSSNQSNISSGDIKTEIEHIINREVKYRLRKKGLTDDITFTRTGPSRSLAVIDEEGSGDSSKTSRRQSYLSDKKSDNEELEDDVFDNNHSQPASKHLIPQKCIRVDAKIKEPEISEARGDWTVKTVEKITGAELVYLTDSSSSTSSIYDANDEDSKDDDIDVTVRITTPTIEVTDTEKLLSSPYIAENINLKPGEANGMDKSTMLLTYNNDKENKNLKFDEIERPKETAISHEIIILNTDDIKTDLFVKDIVDSRPLKEAPQSEEFHERNENILQSPQKSKENIDQYDLEIKVLKCELNDAINNLIKEVTSDSESNDSPKDMITRQDSSSSLDSSQCTAKYNPTYSSLNDISNIVHDDIGENVHIDSSLSHVKDVLQSVSITQAMKLASNIKKNPVSLKDICLKKISSFPFGQKILEELANVSEKLQGSVLTSSCKKEKTQHILDKEMLQNKELNVPNKKSNYSLQNKDSVSISTTDKNNAPPILPRKSSLKKVQDEQSKPSEQPPKEVLYECLSPSQKMLMEKTNTIIEPDDMIQKCNKDLENSSSPTVSKQHNMSKNQSIGDLTLKSQTGSRLLALLLDSSHSDKLTSTSLNEQHFKQISKAKSNQRELFSKRALEEIDSANFSDGSTTAKTSSFFSSNHFKPIPPPKPRKLSTYFYESDESSDIRQSFQTMRKGKKYFHFSTGNLNKEIESDISSIQNMHRYCSDLRDINKKESAPRRPSLPKDLCEKQMEYICRKEKEIDEEIRRLEQEKNRSPRNKGPRAPMMTDKDTNHSNACNYKSNIFINKDNVFPSSHNYGNTEKNRLSSLFSSSQEELLREKMYSEYVNQMAEREQRKQHKVIKVTKTSDNNISKSMPVLENFDSKMNNRIEEEFITKARERWYKLGIRDPESEDEREKGKNVYREPKILEHKIKVIEAGEEKDVKKLPSHIQEFVKFTVSDKNNDKGDTAIWRPGASPGGEAPSAPSPSAPPPPPPPPVWTPGSNTTSPQIPRKTYRPVHFEDTPPSRRKFGNSDQNGCTSGSESEGRLRTSQSAPATGLNSLGSASRLPKAQNPTVTLLQKAREGQIPRGPSNIPVERDPRLPRDRPSPPKGDPVHALRKEYASEGEGDRSDYERSQKMTDAKKKIEGIGPITKDGMPVALRSEVKDPSRWYKKMYDTIHKNKFDEDYVTIRYKNRRGEPQRPSSNRSQYAYFDPRSGYLSEPEGGLRLTTSTWSDAYDSDVTSGPRRRTASVQEERRYDDGSPYLPNNKYSTLASARARQEVYKNQPGRIENYVPGKSSVIDKEAKQWWDEVMDIFDGQNESGTQSQSQASPKEKKDLTSAILSKSNMARALKESGYESDSTLIFRRREDTEAPLSPAERRAAYRDLQAGGEPPIRGFRSPAPPRTESDSAPEPPRRTSHGSFSDSESPSRRYVESDVNIHYRCPVRHDPLPLVPERELARQQAEHMKRLYREQRRNKYLQELQDMQNRRHQDNFMPSQKTIVPLNRYDEAEKIIAKALYTFNGQTARELSFRKGDIINVRRQIDSNWYEGEVHGKIGLFPYNYVELLKSDGVQTLKKPAAVEGKARAKFDFIAQTNLELPLKKGEVVVLTRRIDHNWWEGRNGSKTGIFPDSYVTILQEPSQNKPEPQPILTTPKPVASPAAHGLLNGVDKRSMGAHRYTPQLNSPALSNAPPADIPLQGYITKSTSSLSASERGYGPPTGAGVDLNNSEPLYVDTNAEAVPYRAMYKYRPQNPDELELNEGDTVYVLEKCDDGWYVGSSQRTGRFGTFPGNYVERI